MVSVHIYILLKPVKFCVLASSQGIAAEPAPLGGDLSCSHSSLITLDPPADSSYANNWFAPWLAHF